jgi:hypothetical protein
VAGEECNALHVVTPLLEDPVADWPNWTIACRRSEMEACNGVLASWSRLSTALQKNPSAARPAH